ncbi:hypothetical protein PFISCL1PPCAC_13602, partial [Pristionchus fissidentatus]
FSALLHDGTHRVNENYNKASMRTEATMSNNNEIHFGMRYLNIYDGATKGPSVYEAFNRRLWCAMGVWMIITEYPNTDSMYAVTAATCVTTTAG